MNEYGVMMSTRTSMRVGGPAMMFCEPVDEIGLILSARAFYRAGMPYFILGCGTNVIVRDGGYQGAVISTLKALGDIEGIFTNGKLICSAGATLGKVARRAASEGFSGFEALSGIPGTVGGAIFMNAGAYDHDISEILDTVRVYDVVDGKFITLTNKECELGYRTSIFKMKPYIILSAEFLLRRGDKKTIEVEMAEYTRRRNEKQPVELPSSGSYFKRPEGDYAGRLIEEAGMKGARVGGAQVSEKHAGFIVNTGGATAADVLDLAEAVKAKVAEKFGVELEEEPLIIGN